jgi:hypothetical protein
MGQVQGYGRRCSPPEVIARLKTRTGHRDIIIAAGLEAEPAAVSNYDTLFKIAARAKSLSVNSKVETFVKAADRTQHILKGIASTDGSGLSPERARIADHAVTSTILKIVPADPEHINPTFAFCRSAGMDKNKLRRSIADGCFQSLRAFLQARNDPETRATFDLKKFRPLDYEFDKTGCAICPYFRFDDGPLECPFDGAGMADEVRRIRQVCATDYVHVQSLEDIRKKKMQQRTAWPPTQNGQRTLERSPTPSGPASTDEALCKRNNKTKDVPTGFMT